MSRVKDMIIERENIIIELMRKMEDFGDDEIFDAWLELGLPIEEEELFDIVTDNELYEYTINTAEKFLKEIEETP